MEHNEPISRNVWGRSWHWINDRYAFDHLFSSLVEVPIPRTVQTYYLGGITLFLFSVQVITGVLLAIYYQPSPGTAYDSILLIMNDVRFGWLIRSIHAWGANLMIIFCVLHLLRVYLQGAYKPPRELTWVAGMLLLLITLGFGFTGYLLPWDQRAYWATVVGSEIAGALPVIGNFALEFVRGGQEITGLTLSRFFAAHVLVLPLTLGAMILIHLVMIHQQGLADPVEYPLNNKTIDEESANHSVEQYAGEASPNGSKWLPFFPNYVLDEVIAWYVLLGIIVVLASLLPAGLEESADPLTTPAHVKPEWYFLAVYQVLKRVPRTVGVMLPIVGILFLIIWPFLDRNPHKEWRYRPFAVGVAVLVTIAMIVLSIWGWRS
jgi:quinol-cytochrome oxidoreductase complex cytochrome b subunit